MAKKRICLRQKQIQNTKNLPQKSCTPGEAGEGQIQCNGSQASSTEEYLPHNTQGKEQILY